MARIVFQLRDPEGNLVEIETSEMEFDKVLAGYPNFLRLICEHGFSPIKAKGNGAKQEKIRFDGKTCPKCGPGVFMASHKDRWTCGKCKYSERK